MADDGSPITDDGSVIAPGAVQAPPDPGATSSTTTSCILTIVTLLAILGFGVPDGFTVDQSLLGGLAGSSASTPVNTGNTAVVNPAPQFPLPSPAESPSPSPLPTQAPATPASGGTGSTGGGGGCTPVVPATAQLQDGNGSRTVASSGSYTAKGSVTATLSNVKACPGHHVYFKLVDQEGKNLDCQFGSSGNITVHITPFTSPTDTVILQAIHGDNCP